jgi:tight adherence protein B
MNRSRLRPLAAAAALALALVGLAAPAVGAQTSAGPADAVVHLVDASAAPTTVSILTDGLGLGAAEVTLWENTSLIQPTVGRASARGQRAELVLVIDTAERLASGGAFDAMKRELVAEIRSLPAGTAVAVVAASDFALVTQPLTTDLEAAASAVNGLRLSTSSALWDAIARGTEQYKADASEAVRTVIAVSSAADSSITGTPAQAAATLLRSGAQLVSVRFRGGETGLATVASQAGGITYGVEQDADLPAVLDQAIGVAADRLVLEYRSQVSVGELANVELVLGDQRTAFSYTGGARFDRVTSIAPIVADQRFAVPVLSDLLAGSTGKYLAVVLALVGVGLAAWSLGSMMGSNDDGLRGRLSRYAGDHTSGGDDDDAGRSHSAFVKRAVAVTENLARDRGLLPKTEKLLERADMPLRPAEALFFYGVVVVGGLLGGALITRSPLPSLFLAALAAALPLVVIKIKTVRRFRAFEAQLPDALQLLAGTLRAGYSLPQGLDAVSHEIEDPMGAELRRVMSEAQLGRELEEALEGAANRLNSPDFAWAVMAVGIQREVGGNLNELLMTVSDTMVARSRLRGEVRALTAEGKLSALILGGLPPALGAVMYTMNPEYINVLFSRTIGHILIGVAALAMTVGLLWMKKVITIDV